MVAVKRENDEFRVVVWPADPVIGWYAGDEAKPVCKQIKKQIERHIDDISHVEIQWDVVKTCEYCGSNWTEDDDHYNGGCCDEDEKHKPEDMVEVER